MERPWNHGRALQIRVVPAGDVPPGQLKATVINGTMLVADMTATPAILESSLVLLLREMLHQKPEDD